MAIELNENNFAQEVLESKVPVLVDFWASWCAPCRAMAPVLEELSQEQQGKIKVCKVNVDENPNLATQYGIMSIPCFILFKDGKESGKQIGAVSKEALLSLA